MKKTSLIYTVTALVVALLLFTVAVWMRFFLIAKAGGINNLSVEVMTYDSKERKLGLLNTRLNDLSANRQTVDNFFLNDSDVVTFIETLESLGKKLGISLEIEHADTSSNSVFTVKSTGSFKVLYTMIGLIENLPYPIFIESADVTFGPVAGQTKSVWTSLITIRILNVSADTKSQ